MIDCPKDRLQKAILADKVDEMLEGSSEIKGSEHWINCLRCSDNKGEDNEEHTVCCMYDPKNQVILKNEPMSVASAV